MQWQPIATSYKGRKANSDSCFYFCACGAYRKLRNVRQIQKWRKKWLELLKSIWKKGVTWKDIHEDIVQILAEDSFWYATGTVGLWNSNGTGSLSPPKTSITDEQVDVIHRMILYDRCHPVQQIAKSMDINSDSVHTVLIEILKKCKWSIRWVPSFLRPQHKLKTIDISRSLLTHFQANPKNVHRTQVNQDKTSPRRDWNTLILHLSGGLSR